MPVTRTSSRSRVTTAVARATIDAIPAPAPAIPALKAASTAAPSVSAGSVTTVDAVGDGYAEHDASVEARCHARPDRLRRRGLCRRAGEGAGGGHGSGAQGEQQALGTD